MTFKHEDPWEIEQEELLFDLKSDGFPWSRIAKIMRRSESACKSKHQKLMRKRGTFAVEPNRDRSEALKRAELQEVNRLFVDRLYEFHGVWS